MYGLFTYMFGFCTYMFLILLKIIFKRYLKTTLRWLGIYKKYKQNVIMNKDNLIWTSNYFEARDLFRFYSNKSYKHYTKKEDSLYLDESEDATIDYLYLQNESNRLTIIISGTHGVEGYCGTALQCYTLEKMIHSCYECSDWHKSSYLFIHALNPYGYMYNRRFTKNNVDLNRNYLNTFEKTDYPKQIYNLVTTSLFSFAFLWTFICTLYKYGYTKAREYIVKGQYNYRDGLFYGGNKKEKNITILERILDKISYTQFNQVYVFDIHSGLGSYGHLSLMVQQNTYRSLYSSINCNSTTQLVNMSIDNIYKDSKGSIVEGIATYLKKNEYEGKIFPIILEYGTYSNLQIFAGLLQENYWYFRDEENSSSMQIKLQELFYVDEDDWKKLVLQNYKDIFRQILSIK